MWRRAPASGVPSYRWAKNGLLPIGSAGRWNVLHRSSDKIGFSQRPDPEFPLDTLKTLFAKAQRELSEIAGRTIQLEIEPGRFYVAPTGALVVRVTDIKNANTNAKGEGAKFAIIGAGFVDLIRPTMYGSWHRIESSARRARKLLRLSSTGPLCESDDVFTRDDAELLQPRDEVLQCFGIPARDMSLV